MAEADELVRQAVSAFQAGRKAEARTLLEGVVDQNPQHAEAWLYLSALVDSLEEQEICLENVLTIQPGNEKARKGLETVRQKLGKAAPGPAAGASSAPSKPKSGASSPPIGAEFGMASGDSLLGETEEPPSPFDFNFGGDAPAPTSPPADDASFDWFSGGAEPFGSPGGETVQGSVAPPSTSVDWGRDDRPAAYGSGKDVEMPSAQEWDSWVQGLNISQDAPTPPTSPGTPASPFMTDDAGPFGETSYMVDDSPFGEESAPGQAATSPFGDSSPWSSPFGEETASDEAPAEDSFPVFGGQRSSPAAGSSSPFSSGVFYEEEVDDSPFAFDADAVEIGEDDLDFSFEEGEDEPDTGAPAQAAKPSAAAPRPGAEYFRLIPGEIEAKAGGVGQRSLMLLGGIVTLIVLNAASFALLLL